MIHSDIVFIDSFHDFITTFPAVLVLSSPGAASAGEDHARQSRAARAAAEPGPPLGGAGAAAQAAGGWAMWRRLMMNMS